MKKEDTSDSASSSENESSDQESEENEEVKGKMDSIRKELSEVPFDELQELQDRVGSKVYNEALFGKKPVKPTEHQEMQRKKFKRANKNRPQEMSSKKTVTRHREVMQTKKKVNRDPRFDDLSGDFNEDAFSCNYEFINDIKERERKQIEKEMKKTKNPDRKEQLKRLIQRMDQQEVSRKKNEERKLVDRDYKKQERELIKQGKKPYFMKKSDQKKNELAEKYQQLKKSGKVESYLKQKHKKNASKDRKHLPYSASSSR